ncbi:MAG: ComEA family DNA-binding protein [Lachnospiraceae bacterium]|nr:ComEA family DNA-binding protein [Lachnospiraceae bacterium]
MPDSRMRYKAGKISFLLVCLFLCTACGKQTAYFEAGSEPIQQVEEKELVSEETKETEEDSQIHIVNINTADAEELMTLPGIGKVRAAAIIEHRQREGDFEKIEDIMNVKGIKTGIFSKINSLICVK